VKAFARDPGTGTTDNCPTKTFRVASFPYLSVWGGDAAAGFAPQNGDGTCSENDQAGFPSWTNGAPDWTGSGAEFAVQALGDIKAFASARGDQSISPADPSALAFSNVPGNGVTVTPSSAPAVFGGQYRALNGVSCDYTSDMPAPLTTDQTINGRAVSTTDKVYVKGADVIIKGNIAYTTNAWGSTAAIPSFKLVVVGGNIYIDSNVTELDGTYVAEKDNSGNGGTIFTCTTGAIPWAPWDDTTGFYNACSKQLTIYGSFVAQQVRFLRTHGTTSQATVGEDWTNTTSAEKFVYGPELWLANLKTTPSSRDASITGLPPVL
jgi:hypothetical protein